MYTKNVPFKDFHGKPRNATLYFNLTEIEVFKHVPEFKKIFDWKDSLHGDVRELQTEEVMEFYTAFEQILLDAYGKPSEDGLQFNKAGRFEFEESAAFAAYMIMCLTDPQETQRLLDGIMPEGMEDIVRRQTEALDRMEKDNPAQAEEVARLRAQIAELESQKSASGS